MQFTTVLLCLATVAAASTSPAKNFKRQDLDPQTVCGNSFVDCGNGFCCTEGETCGEIGNTGVPNCGGLDPARPYNVGAGDSISSVLDNAESVISSLVGEATQIPAGLISDLATLTAIPSEVATFLPSSLRTLAPSDLLTHLPTELQPTATGAEASEGAAAGLKVGGTFGAWTSMGIWTAAAFGGMAWVFVR